MRVQPGAAVGRGELRLVKRAAADLEFLLRAIDVGQLFEAGDDAGDRLADLRRGAHRGPVNGGWRVRNADRRPSLRHSDSPAGEHAFGDRGDHVDFAARAVVAARAAVAHADVVEHRFLRRRLRLFVAGEHGQDDRFARQAVGVAGVERGAQVDDLVEVAERFGGERGVGIRAVQVAAQAEADFELAGGRAFDAGHRVAAGRRRQLRRRSGFAAARRSRP